LQSKEKVLIPKQGSHRHSNRAVRDRVKSTQEKKGSRVRKKGAKYALKECGSEDSEEKRGTKIIRVSYTTASLRNVVQNGGT